MVYFQSMRDYECVLVFTSDKSKETRDKVIDKIKKDLDFLGGKISLEDEWGKKQLTYRIKKEDEAFFVYWEMGMEPARLNEFEGKMKLNEEILRYLLVKKDGVSKKPANTETRKESETLKKKPAKKVSEKSEPIKSKKVEEVKKGKRPKAKK